MEIRILGAHNSESANTRLVSLLVDQVLAIDAGSITSSLHFAQQRELKAVFLTHHHFDHVRDLPILGLNLYAQRTVEVYALQSALNIVSSCLLTDKMSLSHKPL